MWKKNVENNHTLPEISALSNSSRNPLLKAELCLLLIHKYTYNIQSLYRFFSYVLNLITIGHSLFVQSELLFERLLVSSTSCEGQGVFISFFQTSL